MIYGTASAFATGGSANAIAAASWAGQILLHEWMHRCIANPPGVEDGYLCMGIRHMAAPPWFLAMGRRYGCLDDGCGAAPDGMVLFIWTVPGEDAPFPGVLSGMWEQGTC